MYYVLSWLWGECCACCSFFNIIFIWKDFKTWKWSRPAERNACRLSFLHKLSWAGFGDCKSFRNVIVVSFSKDKQEVDKKIWDLECFLALLSPPKIATLLNIHHMLCGRAAKILLHWKQDCQPTGGGEQIGWAFGCIAKKAIFPSDRFFLKLYTFSEQISQNHGVRT